MKIKKLGVVLLMLCFIFSSAGIQVYAATVGEQLSEPESGWRRYDDSDSHIVYEGENWGLAPDNNYYNDVAHSADKTKGSTLDHKVRFGFIGTKFRIIAGYNATDHSSNVEVYIDGKFVESYSEYISGGSSPLMLVYEKSGLDSGFHSVELINKSDNHHFIIDAIDIDDTGELKAYDEVVAESSVLDIEPEKETIYLSETVSANLVINNINEIAAEDIRIDYDEEKLEFLGFEEVDGMKLVKSIEETSTGNLRVIVASKGEANIVNAKEVLLKLNFKGIETGEALVDITKGRVTDGIEMEKDLTDVECDQGTIVIEALADVNNSGEFTLLDLGIDARHLSKDPAAPELAAYNTDIVVNNAIDEDDLLEIGRLILENANYTPNN